MAFEPQLKQTLLIRFTRWAIWGTIFTVGLGFAYYFLPSSIVETDCTIQINSGVENITPVIAEGVRPIDTAMVLLGSRHVIGQVVDALHLDIQATPIRFPVIGQAIARFHDPQLGLNHPLFDFSTLLDTHHYAWGGEKIQVTHLEVPSFFLGKSFTLIAGKENSYQLFKPIGSERNTPEMIFTGHVGETASTTIGGSLLTLNVSVLNARPGTAFILTRQHRHTAITTLQAQLRIVEKGVHSGIISITLRGADPVQNVATLNALVHLYSRHYTEHISKKIEQSLTVLKQQLTEIHQQIAAAEMTLRSEDATDTTICPINQVAINTVEQAHLIQKRTEVAQRLSPGHPALSALDAKIARLKATEAHQPCVVHPHSASSQMTLELAIQRYRATLTKIDIFEAIRADPPTIQMIDEAVFLDLPE